MAVPQGTDSIVATITAGFIAVGPDLGHFALVAFGAWIGCMHTVAKTDFQGSRSAALWYMLRWIGTAILLTGAASALLMKYTGLPADRWPGVVAFAITFLADKWPTWLKEAGDALLRRRLGDPQQPQ